MMASTVVDASDEPSERDTARHLRAEFRGSASDYFRIWIAHMCLSALTLGLYAPWAAVRMKQYLYTHTLLDGEPFRYDAPPFVILIGRIVTTGFFAVTYGIAWLAPQLQWVVSLSLLLALPAIVVRANRFDARYTAYRNLRFRFAGSYGGALGSFFGAALLGCTLVGLPWAYRRVKLYMVRQWSFGGVRARLSLRARRLLVPFLIGGMLWGAGAACALALLVWGMHGRELVPNWVLPGVILPLYLGHLAAFSILQASAANLVWRGTRLGPLRFRSTLRARDLALLYLTNAAAVLASFGLLIPWATVRLARYRAAHLSATLFGDWSELSQAESTPIGAVGSEMAQSLFLEVPV
ncbi:MAG TPA: YjgN family protein, partial [Polyangiaceae bacterium]|nr:YjgN family protein [Polyangiaceae bacterium]